MEYQGYAKIQLRVSSLLQARRLRFPFVDAETGNFRWRRFFLVLLNTLGSCLNIPVLFYMSFYVMAIYPAIDVKPMDMISVTFFASAISIILDFFIGYGFDKFVKPNYNQRPTVWIRNILAILGTIGLIVALSFFFKTGITDADGILQFRWTILVIFICMTLVNCTAVKNSVNYSPSQDNRMKVLHVEYFIKAFILFLYVVIPLWAKHNSGDCDCGDTCKNNPGDQTCITCLDTCDTFSGDRLNYFKTTSVVFTVIFGLANILSQLLVQTRNDEDREEIPTTYNRRLNELFSNKFVISGFLISLLEFTIIFGFATWAYHYINVDTTITATCVEKFGSSAYACSKSFWLQIVMVLILLIPLYTFFIKITRSYIFYASMLMSVLTFISGFLIIIINANDTLIFTFIAAFMAGGFSILAANKLVFSSGIFYDEYKSGTAQGHLPSGLFLLSVKLGFLLSLAFHLTLMGDDRTGLLKGFGIYTLIASVIILGLKYYVNRANLQAFDKIQIAIERNTDLQDDDIAFYDPITKAPLRCPVTSYHALEKKFIRLMYNLNKKDMAEMINGQPTAVTSRAVKKMVIFSVLVVLSSILVVAFGGKMNTAWAWLLLILVLYIPIGIMLVIYEYNIWAAVNYMESPKFKNVHRDVLLRFSLIVEGLH